MRERALPIQIEEARHNCKYFIREFCYTLDEHDKIEPIKRFPNKEYIWDMVELFKSERLLLIEKSRQMMVTWTMVACHLWDAMFNPARRIFFQSKKELDANNLVDRAKFLYDHLPREMKQQYPTKEPQAYLKLVFPKWHSMIQGVPQGPDVLRQYTASRIFMDEAAFQERLSEAYVAAKPTVDGGGSLVMTSSPNGKTFFYLVARDKI